MRVSEHIVIVILIFVVFAPNAFGAGNKHKYSTISGLVDIKLKVGNVNNILSNTTASKGVVNIGSIRQSNIRGNLNIEKIEVGNISNELKNTYNSSAVVNIGSIQNSQIKDARIKVKVKNVRNKVIGGSNNRSNLQIGSINNSGIKGKTDINITVTRNVENTLRGGNGNYSEISIGSISGEDDDENNQQNLVANRGLASQWQQNISRSIEKISVLNKGGIARNKISGAFASKSSLKEYTNPTNSKNVKNQIQKETSIDSKGRKLHLAGRERVEGIFQFGQAVATTALYNAYMDYKKGKLTKKQFADLSAAIKLLEKKTVQGILSIKQRNNILLSRKLTSKFVHKQIAHYNKKYMDLRNKINKRNSGKNSISVGNKDQQLVIPINGKVALGVNTKEVFDPGGKNGGVTRSYSKKAMQTGINKLKLKTSKDIAKKLNLNKKRDFEIAARLLAGEELLNRSLDGKFSKRMEVYYVQYALSNVGAKKIREINRSFDQAIKNGDLEKNGKSYIYQLSYVDKDGNEKDGKFFRINATSDKYGASATAGTINIGKNFKRTIPISGAYILGPEIIHHEFAHTRYGATSKRVIGSRLDGQNEAFVVKNYENIYRQSFGWPDRKEYCFKYGCIDTKHAKQ